MKRPVFVAGRGAVSGFGRGLPALVDNVFAGRTAVQPRRRTAWFRAPTEVAAEYPADDCGGVDEHDLPLWAAALAAEEAFEEAGQPDRRRMALFLATTKGDMSGIVGDGDGLGSPMRLAQRMHHRLELGLPPTALSCACASGVLGIGMAARRIESGELDRALIVAADALNHFIVAGFGGLGALDPEVCRPFDTTRRGVSLGDGAGVMLLTAHERESIGVRVVGHAGANDACHATGPDYAGLGIGLAASRAMRMAAIAPADVDVLHLHGTGTRANDKSEAIGLGNVWAAALGRTPPAFGTKAQTGHTLGAAGVIESLLAIAALERGQVPGNHGLQQTDVDERLDLVTTPRQLQRRRYAVKVASGFGGVQGAVVFAA